MSMKYQPMAKCWNREKMRAGKARVEGWTRREMEGRMRRRGGRRRKSVQEKYTMSTERGTAEENQRPGPSFRLSEIIGMIYEA